MRARAALRRSKDLFREPVHAVERWGESVGARLTCQLVPLTSIDRWAVKAGDFDAPFAVQGGVCVVKCHLNPVKFLTPNTQLAIFKKNRKNGSFSRK